MDRTPVKKSLEKRTILSSPECLLDITSPSSPALSTSARTAKNLVTNFKKLVEEWKQLSVKSLVVIKKISQTKLKSLEENEFYPTELESLFASIEDVGSGYQNTVISMNMLRKQFEALSKLSVAPEPLVNTWSATYLSNFIQNVVSAYELELQAKQCVLENIAHAKESSQLAMYVAVWEYEVYLRDVSQGLASLCKEMDA